MILELILFGCLSAASFMAIVLIYIALRNYKAHKFFKQKCPNLPVAKNQNLLFGSTNLLFGKRSWLQLDHTHRKLGKTFGFYYVNEPFVCTTDLELIKQMTIVKPSEHLYRINFHIPSEEIDKDDIYFCKPDQWKHIRKAFAPATTSHKFKTPNVRAEVDHVIDKFVSSIEFKLKAAEAELGRPEIVLDVDEAFHRFTLEIAFTCFYKQKDTVDFYAEQNYYTKSLDDAARTLAGPMMAIAILLQPFYAIFSVIIKHFHPTRHIRREVMNSIKRMTKANLNARKQIEEAKSRDKSGKFDPDNFVLDDGSRFSRNMIDYVVDQYCAGKLTRDEYFHSAFFLFFAATKTTADALAKIIYHLARDHRVQVKLRDSIKEEGIESQYLSWVMHESMRLFPPAHIGCSRTISSDLMCEAGLIPAGTVVLTPAYTIHRLKEYWGDDAEEFRPERWARSKQFHPAQYLAFGMGLRICPGREFALNEMKLLLEAMLSRFTFDVLPETADPKDFDAPGLVFMVSHGPVNIKISRIVCSSVNNGFSD